ncbi:MAG: DUF2490 domain-containing protein [Bacteroidales bacterium]|nr:DUF2490 domain-containing protein [Bacteroidales bacterium]
MGERVKMYRWLMLMIFMIYGLNGFVQDRFRAGILPKINVSAKISGDLKLTGNIESRNLLYDNPGNGEGKFDYKIQVVDAAVYLSLKTHLNHSLTGGYLYRSREDQIFHRFIQQYSIVNNLDAFRLGHRFASDQTLDPDGNWEIRARYRITAEKPLSGDNVDPKEFYFKASNEYLGEFENNETGLEIRLVALIGYEVDKQNKVEIGPDFRMSDITYNGINQVLWFTLSWYFRVN